MKSPTFGSTVTNCDNVSKKENTSSFTSGIAVNIVNKGYYGSPA